MLPYLFVLFAIAVRFLPFAGPLNVLPHAWHFTPLAASLLFFGARGSRRQMWVPLVARIAARSGSARRASSLSLAATPSSRSRMTASAPEVAALAMKSGRDAGTKRSERGTSGLTPAPWPSLASPAARPLL